LNNFFEVDHLVQEEMFQLKTNAQYKLAMVSLKSYHSNFFIIESLDTCSLTLQFEDIFEDPNLLASQILCLNETRIKNVHFNSKFYNEFKNDVECCCCPFVVGSHFQVPMNLLFAYL
jgi:hypothetical protein